MCLLALWFCPSASKDLWHLKVLPSEIMICTGIWHISDIISKQIISPRLCCGTLKPIASAMTCFHFRSVSAVLGFCMPSVAAILSSFCMLVSLSLSPRHRDHLLFEFQGIDYLAHLLVFFSIDCVFHTVSHQHQQKADEETASNFADICDLPNCFARYRWHASLSLWQPCYVMCLLQPFLLLHMSLHQNLCSKLVVQLHCCKHCGKFAISSAACSCSAGRGQRVRDGLKLWPAADCHAQRVPRLQAAGIWCLRAASRRCLRSCRRKWQRCMHRVSSLTFPCFKPTRSTATLSANTCSSITQRARTTCASTSSTMSRPTRC